MRFFQTLALAGLTLFTTNAFAGSPDEQVRGILDQVKDQIPAAYEVDGDGDFKLTVMLEGGRSQIVYINSGTEEWEGIVIREVWGPSFPSKGKGFSAKDAMMLLLDSQDKKLGAWQAYPQAKGVYAVFNVKIGAEMDSASLASVVRYVARAADAMEVTMTKGKDAY